MRWPAKSGCSESRSGPRRWSGRFAPLSIALRRPARPDAGATQPRYSRVSPAGFQTGLSLFWMGVSKKVGSKDPTPRSTDPTPRMDGTDATYDAARRTFEGRLVSMLEDP